MRSGFPTKIFYAFSLCFHACCIPRSYPRRFRRRNNIWWRTDYEAPRHEVFSRGHIAAVRDRRDAGLTFLRFYKPTVQW